MPRATVFSRLGAAAILAIGLSACQAPPPVVEAPVDAAEVQGIAGFLNGLTRLQANFVQTGDLGDGAGMIWLDRPGHLRIDYAGPDSSVMVASGGRVVVTDRRTHAVTTMAVSRTPLGILLAPSITLTGDVTVLAVKHLAGQTQIILRRTSAPAQGTLSLAFTEHPLVLTSVSLVDARGPAPDHGTVRDPDRSGHHPGSVRKPGQLREPAIAGASLRLPAATPLPGLDPVVLPDGLSPSDRAGFRRRRACGRQEAELDRPLREAPVAQLDRAPDYESGGWKFESFRVRQSFSFTTSFLGASGSRPTSGAAPGQARGSSARPFVHRISARS